MLLEVNLLTNYPGRRRGAAGGPRKGRFETPFPALTSSSNFVLLAAMSPSQSSPDRSRRLIRSLLPIACLLLPLVLRAQEEKLPPADLAIVQQEWPKAKKTFTGLRYLVERPGHGQPPNSGDKVYVLYTGRLLNGTVFDRDLDPKRPFSFRVDRYAVIPGWDEALELMSVGEKLLVILPSDLGYGVRGSLPLIPPNATLVFEIQLLKIEREQQPY